MTRYVLLNRGYPVTIVPPLCSALYCARIIPALKGMGTWKSLFTAHDADLTEGTASITELGTSQNNCLSYLRLP